MSLTSFDTVMRREQFIEGERHVHRAVVGFRTGSGNALVRNDGDVVSTLELFRRRAVPLLAAGRIERHRWLLAFWLLGGAAIGLFSLACAALGFNLTPAALVLLLVVIFLALFESCISSVFFSVLAVGCLNFWFVGPLHTFIIGSRHDLATLIVFLLSSLFAACLIRLVHSLGVSEREQASLLDLTSDAVFVRDADDIITYWNRGAEELYGWSRHEAMGKVAHELLKTRFQVSLLEINDALRRSGRWEGELIRTTRTGRRISVSSRWSHRLEDRRNSVGTLECNTDISERKRTEGELNRSQAAYLAEAQKLSNTGSFGWNLSTGELFWSGETFRIFGVEEGATPSMALVLERTHPDDLPVVRDLLVNAHADRRDFRHEHRLLMPNGDVKHVRVVARCDFGSKNSPQFVGAVMDITAQKEAYAKLEKSEQRYRYLFDRMPIALWQLNASNLVARFKQLRSEGVTDLDAYFDENPAFLRSCMEAMIFEEANERGVQMFGGRGADEFKGKSVVGTFEESSATFRRAMVSRYRGNTNFEEETKMVTLDGRIVDVLFTTARVGLSKDPDTSLVGVLDISARVEAERRLQQVQAEFAHAARLSVLGELTASIAHEINQPLAAIANAGAAGLRWINRPKPDLDEVRDSLTSMLHDAKRAAELIGRIRAMANGKPPERTQLDLDEVIQEALQFLRHEIQARSATVTHEKSRQPLVIAGDRTQVHQVIVNLAINALQAPRPQRSKPYIVVRSGTSARNRAVFTVEDNGAGINPGHASQLFESFFTTKETGMGMGLRICKSIVEAHGGEITADAVSSIGGACFSVNLPIVPA